MKKRLTYLISILLAFAAGFALCYALLMGDPEVRRPTRKINQVAMLNIDKKVYSPLTLKEPPRLDWEPYIIQPTLPPRIVEPYVFRPSTKALSRGQSEGWKYEFVPKTNGTRRP